MSSLTAMDRNLLEKFLNMKSGYVLNFSDKTFEDFFVESVDVDIHDKQFTIIGTSKANKMRAFWKVQPDHVVCKLLTDLIDYDDSIHDQRAEEDRALIEKCRQIVSRLLAGSPRLDHLKKHAAVLDAKHLVQQIRRMELSVETDPSLAIGTAKELIETCCKTILAERSVTISGTADVSTLTKETLKALKLVPEGIPDAARGADVIKRLLSNLGTIGNGLAELRGLYGTGHGKHGSSTGLSTRHAKLAVGAAATLTVFLFETHQETKS